MIGLEFYSFDQMIDVMEISSNKQPLRINLDPTIPDTNMTINAVLIVFGQMGEVGTNAIVEQATVLQETTVTFVENEDCELVQNVETGELVFFDRIKDDMICVQGVDGNKEQWSGDSGGPYRIPSMDQAYPTGDLQIGIVSWSYGGLCPSEYPAVGARTSVFEWIRWMTCEHCSPPPDYMNCTDESNIW
jgi:secreted trypsin-like serine protease